MRLSEQEHTEHETTARVRQWKLMRGEEFADIDRENTVVVVSCSPMEVHGPHLPVCTDRLEARALSVRIMELLCERDPYISFLELPPLYTATDVLPQQGSLNFRPSTIIRTLEDIGRTLTAQGFRKIWVSSFHGGPRHWVALEKGCANVNARHGAEMVSLFSMLIGDLTGGKVDLAHVLGHIDGTSPEAFDGDQHAGLLETAMMLHLLPDYIAPHEHLPKETIALEVRHQGREGTSRGLSRVRALFTGFAHTIRHYETHTYTGSPALATPELGEAFLNELSLLSADALEKVWTGQRTPEECHSPLWPLWPLFTNDLVANTFYKVLGHKSQVW